LAKPTTIAHQNPGVCFNESCVIFCIVHCGHVLGYRCLAGACPAWHPYRVQEGPFTYCYRFPEALIRLRSEAFWAAAILLASNGFDKVGILPWL
jgi:hypothetical protein